MIVLLGEHQTGTATSFFEALCKAGRSRGRRRRINSLVTPCLIWASDEWKNGEKRNKSVFMPENEVLKAAGLSPNGYRLCLETVRSSLTGLFHGSRRLVRKFSSALEREGLGDSEAAGKLRVLR